MILIRCLKREKLAVLLLFLFLFFQAFTELTLPGYTAKLVDVGVQQGGVESVIPKQLSEKSFLGLLSLAGENEKALLSAHYSLKDGVYTYTPLKDEKELSEALKWPEAAAFMIENMRAQGKAPQGAALQEMLDEMKLKMQAMGGDAALTGAAIQFVRAENKALNRDVDALQRNYLWTQGLYMLLLTLIGGLAALLANYTAARAGARVGRDLRAQIFEKVLSFSDREMEGFSTASLITRTGNDISFIQQSSMMLLRTVMFAPIMALGGLYQVSRTNTGLGWITVLGIALILSSAVSTALVITRKFRLMQKLLDRLNLVTRENLLGVSVIRAFLRERHEEERFMKANEDQASVLRKINRTFAVVMPLIGLIMTALTLLIVWFGAEGISRGQMQVGDMMAFISYTMMIVMSFMMMTIVSVVMLPRALAAAQRVDEVLRVQSSILDVPEPLSAPHTGEIRFNKVSYRFPDSQTDTLHELDFTIKPGEMTAVIGATGSGKSTILRLIPRFADPTEGSITLGGVDIRQLKLKELRGQIGYVPQKARLFSGTAQSNLSFGNPLMPREQWVKAAQMAQAEGFLLEKEGGYETPIAQGGGNLSGGQKQRLSLARALAIKPRFLLLDDSFSALDAQTELQVRKALKNSDEPLGILVVTQRVSSIMNAQHILVLEEGRLVGEGTHESLLEDCPIYRQIAQSQLSEKDLQLQKGVAQ